jgi:hypothetical protein
MGFTDELLESSVLEWHVRRRLHPRSDAMLGKQYAGLQL